MKTRPSSVPLYSLTDLARYARAERQFVRRLYIGYRDRGAERPPVLHPVVSGRAPFSFEDLIEASLVTALRARRISLQAIREARSIAEREIGHHPFARRDILIAGSDIFMRAGDHLDGEQLAALTQGGQRALEPVLAQYLQLVDWEEGWPAEWRPRGGVVRQNPEVEYGLPQVRGVRTEVLRGRFEADEPISVIASDFGLSTDEVEHALRYELWLRPAA
jgi:uncharacterized protein (DUF433 family)